MSTSLDGLRVACLTANEGVEEVELTRPRDALHEVEAVVTLVAPDPGEIASFNHLDRAGTYEVDRTVKEVSADDFDALLLPGGVANADFLRADNGAVELTRAFFEQGKPVAVICHGPWTLVEAGVLEGRTLTSWPSLQTDIRNAGGEWVDAEVKVCEGGPNVIVSSRKPDDLPAFCDAMIEAFAQGPRDQGAVPADSPARGVLDPSDGDPPEPSEPG